MNYPLNIYDEIISYQLLLKLFSEKCVLMQLIHHHREIQIDDQRIQGRSVRAGCGRKAPEIDGTRKQYSGPENLPTKLLFFPTGNG
jgi:hypothetical protein